MCALGNWISISKHKLSELVSSHEVFDTSGNGKKSHFFSKWRVTLTFDLYMNKMHLFYGSNFWKLLIMTFISNIYQIIASVISTTMKLSSIENTLQTASFTIFHHLILWPWPWPLCDKYKMFYLFFISWVHSISLV